MFSGQIEFEPVGSPPSGNPPQNLTCQIDQHLALRPLELRDADALFRLVDDNRTYLKQWLPWLDNNQTAADSRTFIRTSEDRANNELISAIYTDHKLIGIIGLNYIDWKNRLSGIGYWLGEPYQRQGIITRACKAVLNYGFTTLNLNRIDIRCATENIRSQAVAKRLGLMYEGTIRDAEWLYDHFVDHHVYSMLQREWQAQITNQITNQITAQITT
jgi:ribosomal-protein-serine acetyltransferase